VHTLYFTPHHPQQREKSWTLHTNDTNGLAMV